MVALDEMSAALVRIESPQNGLCRPCLRFVKRTRR
jgi:hypothetical protein